MSEAPGKTSFYDLSLTEPVIKVLAELGYEVPTPIQAQTIPLVRDGRDVVGQAQTGTGKTAAFALPLLSRIDMQRRQVQVLVLTPTRELAIQVAEAFQRYAVYIPGFQVLPIYGGQAYDGQLRSLKRGVHVVVGTPGRVMDHMRRKTLRLDNLSCLVLDEADEMLRMGFIDDVEWILEQTPKNHQTALFSATMPDPIRRIAEKHLRDPAQISIKERTSAADKIRQRHWMVSGKEHKLAALTRILEAETFDGILIFVRTRTMTVELAGKLEARGYACSALSGDMVQKRREDTVTQLKKGRLDILVATDVAARGLDIDRISHVINFDIPTDVESYVHRIGRTGRAGREGEAILFVAPRERRLLYSIERGTKQKIPLLELPSTETINDQRIARFKQSITDVLATEDLGQFRMIIEQYQQEHNVTALDMASGLAKMVQGDEPLLLAADAHRDRPKPERQDRNPSRQSRNEIQQDRSLTPTEPDKRDTRPVRDKTNPPPPPEAGIERFRLEVGYDHGVKPGNIVGAIANEADLDSAHIGRIEIYDDYSTIDLPEGMPNDLLKVLKKVWVCGQKLQITREDGKMPNLKQVENNKGHSRKRPAPTSAKRAQTHRPEKNDNEKKEYDNNSAKDKKKVLTTTSEQIGSISNEQTVISNEVSHNNNEVSVTSTQPDTTDKETIAEIANPGVPNKETAPLIASPDVSRQNIVKTINTTKDAAPSAKKSKKVRTKGRTPDGKKDRHRKRK